MRVCNRCIMNDLSDQTIRFDEQGRCNYCTEALAAINTTTYFPNEEGAARLEKLLAQIKSDGRGKPYDCIMGISGGLDSSYLAYLGAKKWGLRILAAHVDDGFDTEISKNNIRKLIEATGIDMRIIRPDPVQFNALTKAFMLAGVPNLAVPQDSTLFAFLYDFARKNRIKYFLSGGNFALECILQRGNTYLYTDVVNIKDIHKRFGTEPIDKLKFISHYRMHLDKRLLGLQSVLPLNLIDYNRDRAFRELYEFCGFEYYGRKHLENSLTAFIQTYWFYKKFGVDKRTSHLSSMIASGQMTRERALEEMKEPIYDEAAMQATIAMIKEKLRLSDEEFDRIMAAPSKQHEDYRTDQLWKFVTAVRIRGSALKRWIRARKNS